MINFELQKAKKKIRQAIDGKYAQKTVATVAAAVGTRHVAIDGNLASATLPDGSSGAVEVVNAGRLASARYELRTGGTVSVVSGGGSGGGGGGGGGGISFSEADTRYYTKSQLDIGQLDIRYYTETESDARFLPLTGSAQYQIPVTGSTPFTATYTALSSFAGSGLAFSSGFNIGQGDGIAVNANDIAVRRYVDSGLAFGLDGGLTLGTPIAVSISTTSVVTGVQHGHAVISSSNPGAAASLLASSASGGLTLTTLATTGAISGATNTNTAHALGYATTGYVGFSGFAGFAANGFANTTGYALAQYNTDGTLYINSPTTINIRNSNNQLATFGSTGLTVESGKLVGSNGYVSGWAGSGWRADQNLSVSGQSFAEFDNLSIRGTLSVYELVINQIRATNGTLIVSSAGKIDSVSGSNWTFEDPNASNLCAFAVNDLVIIQSVDVNASTLVKRIVRRVSAVSGKTITVTTAAGAPADTGSAVAGDTVVRIGNTSNAARQGVVLITSDMSNSPYQDVISGVTSWADWTGGTKTRVRMGHLSGITGTANEYGIIAGTGYTSSDSYAKFSTAGVVQNNVDSTWRSGGTTYLQIDATRGIDLRVENSASSSISWSTTVGSGTPISEIKTYISSSANTLEMNVQSSTTSTFSVAAISATNSSSGKTSSISLLGTGASVVNPSSYPDSFTYLSSDLHVFKTTLGGLNIHVVGGDFVNYTTAFHPTISTHQTEFEYDVLYLYGAGDSTSGYRSVGVRDNLFIYKNLFARDTLYAWDTHNQTVEASNKSKFVGTSSGTVSSISLTATTGFYGAAIGFNAHHANDSVSPTASGAFKFLGTQYTGNVTRPGMQFWDGNNGIMSWYYGEAGLASSADVTTWTKTFEISTTLVNSQLPITVSGGTELIKLNGSGTSGNASTGYIAFYDSNTTTRRGFIGDVSSANTDIYLRADTSALHLGDSTSSDVILLSSGGTKILGNIGFYNTTPVARSAAYTQTYATADRTIASRTAAALTNNTGGTVSTTLAAITAGASYAQADMTAVKNALASLADQVNKLRNDHLDTTQGVNSIIDDLQTNGLFQ